MKRIAVRQELCTRCHKCEEACSMTFFKVKDSMKSSIRISDSLMEPVSICNQCGECISICSEEALSRIKNGTVLLNKRQCVGCYMCAGFCPSLSMRIHEALLEPFKCTACGACVKVCPTGAITLEE